MANIYPKSKSGAPPVAKKIPSYENRFSSSPSPKKEKKADAKLNWGLVGIIFLLLLFVALPICISVWDIGSPIKELNS